MLNKLLGTKIGMTQIFDEDRNSVPVTVIDIGGWFVTQIKTAEKDGYVALQLGLPRKRYRGKPFSKDVIFEWLQSKDKFFEHIREVEVEVDDASSYAVGQQILLKDFAVEEKDLDKLLVDVAGVSRGLGFQGVMKRWGFAGGPGGHGSTFHRSPGSIGNMCSQGNVVKGKKLPGQCGCKRVTVKGLKVARVDFDSNCLFVRGAVPGKKNALLFIRKRQIKTG
jgi:large subunit ribosomal protein L3